MQCPPQVSIHIAKSHIQPTNQNLPKSMAAPTAPDERTNRNGEAGRRKTRKPNRRYSEWPKCLLDTFVQSDRESAHSADFFASSNILLSGL